jgi:hypothetical protein
MTKLIVRLSAIGLASAALLVPAASSSATVHKQTVHFAPSRHRLDHWHTKHVLPAEKALRFSIWINGHEVDARGRINKCDYTLFTRHLALDLNYCGSRLRLRYIGAVPFTLRWWLHAPKSYSY